MWKFDRSMSARRRPPGTASLNVESGRARARGSGAVLAGIRSADPAIAGRREARHSSLNPASGGSMERARYRLVTRSDFDGLVCAALLREIDLIDDILFVHPKDMQDGRIEITDRDITANLPYVPSAHRVFDHHASEVERNTGGRDNHVIDPDAPSAARVVYDYYGGAARFPAIHPELLAAVDKADSARYDHRDIVAPQGWTLLNYLMDARTGLGRFREFRVSNYQLMLQLVDACRTQSIDEILALPDVRERVELYESHRELAERQIRRCATVHDKVVVLDLRQEETIYATNRFMIYALFPQCTLSIHRMWGLRRQNTVFAIGKSILDRSAKMNLGSLCLRYGGGGHASAGTCQVENTWSDRILDEIVRTLESYEAARLAFAGIAGDDA
jgi:nanoRNase/pAp phosphatase (c-di-AMP/oligoRNAs hydrolase)